VKCLIDVVQVTASMRFNYKYHILRKRFKIFFGPNKTIDNTCFSGKHNVSGTYVHPYLFLEIASLCNKKVAMTIKNYFYCALYENKIYIDACKKKPIRSTTELNNMNSINDDDFPLKYLNQSQ